MEEDEDEQEEVKRRPIKQDYEDNLSRRRRNDIDTAKVHSDVIYFYIGY
jgi:hypothetical protein